MVGLRKPTLVMGSDKERPKEIKNVVIFGETGVGKSSLVNLLAGANISATSSSAAGCTLDYKRYSLKLGDQEFDIWDTAGLGEGTQGTVPAEKAEAYLKQLLRDLSKASGIGLLVYCVRGTRVRSALLSNYDLFYSAICRKKVPIAIVITGLENQEGNMDTWWLKNEKEFSALQMYFSNYACVTTLESSVENPVLSERRRMSRAALIKMITNTCRTEQWTPAERSWIDTSFPDIRAMLSPTPKERPTPRVANVIMCDVSQDAPAPQCAIKRSITFHNPISLSRSLIRPMSFCSPVLVSNEKSQSKLPFNNAIKCTPEHLYRVYQVPRKQMLSNSKEDMKRDMVVKRGADLLIFCARKEDKEYRDVKSQWEYFNLTYGGDLSPQIVIIIGAVDQQAVEEWWNDAVGTTKPGDASLAYWPLSSDPVTEAAVRIQLRSLVDTRCIASGGASFTRDKQIFRRFTSPPVLDKSLVSLWRKPLGRNNNMNAPQSIQDDVLTGWGVWEHVSVG